MEEAFEDTLGDEDAAVAVELEGGLARVTGGALEKEGDALIDGLAGGLDEGREVGVARGPSGERQTGAYHGGGDLDGVWTGHPDDADGRFPDGGGDSGDGVGGHGG